MFRKEAVKGRVFQLFVPPKYSPERAWPLVVFLHGVGENGTDGERHMSVGLPPFVKAHAEAFPALVLAPQCRGPWKYVGDDERMLFDAIALVRNEWKVDRVYLTGLSQGGCSTFDLGAKFPDRWDALLVVCGAGYPEDAPKLAGVPLRIFHGELDPVVPPSGPNRFDARNVGGRDMAALLPHAKYTEFAGADHFIWDRVYADPETWAWLFAQKRRA